MTAKSFFYVSAGIFLLIAAFMMGTRFARAEPIDPTTGIVLAMDGAAVLRSDGTLWDLQPANYGNNSTPLPRWVREDGANAPNVLPVPLSDIAFWSPIRIVTKDGVGWAWSSLPNSGTYQWYSAGPIPGGSPVSIDNKTWSDMKEGYQK